MKLTLRFSITAFALLLAQVKPLTARSQSYDSIFSLPATTQRLLLVEERLIHQRIQPGGNEALCRAVVQKGAEAERCYANLLLERLRLKALYTDADVAIAKRYLQEAKALDEPALLAIMYYVLADVQRNRQEYNEAFANYLHCYDGLKTDPTGRHYNQSWFLYDIAFQYYLFKDYARAIEIGKAACNLQAKPWLGPWFVSVSTNLVAMGHLKNDDLDSASVWLQKTYNNAIRTKDTAWLGIVFGNRGLLLCKQARWAEAAEELKHGIRLCTAKALWDNVATFSLALADIRLRQGQRTEAGAALVQAAEAYRRHPNTEAAYDYHTLKSRYYREVRDYAAALQAADSADMYNKALQAEFNSNKKILAESNLEFEKKNAEVQLAIQRVAQERWVRYALLALLLLLGTVGVLLYKRQKLRHMLKQERLEMEALKAEEEVHIAKTELHEFTRHAAQQSRLLEHFTLEVERLKGMTETASDGQRQTIDELKRSTVLTDDDWNSFKASFEKVHPGFLLGLKAAYPTLTPAETRYVVFTKLKMAPKEMATVLGISAEGLRNIRFRLRKKIATDAEGDLESVIEGIQ